jgi:hypothetical protein
MADHDVARVRRSGDQGWTIVTGAHKVAVSEADRRWRLRRTDTGLRLGQVRAFGTQRFTWADLLQAPLAAAQLYVLYFPSRFDLPVDAAVTESLLHFGEATPERTSVDFWDPRDEHFSEALDLFGLRSPPALVLVAGRLLQQPDAATEITQSESRYCISFTEQAILLDREHTAAAVNTAHEILTRCEAKEIADYIRARRVKSLLHAIGQLSAALRDELVKLKPQFGLPGGVSVGLG